MTGFNEKVWEYVKQIPPGKVMTYGAIAEALDTHAQPVGNAIAGCPMDVPWWRVVGAGGKVDAGNWKGQRDLLMAKIAMLRHEGVRLSIRVSPRQMIK